MTYSDAEIEAAVEALTEPGRFEEAEALVTRAAPQLQEILAQALAAGGWFEHSQHESPEIRTLLAEEARMGMMVGVAVGWALAAELRRGEQ